MGFTDHTDTNTSTTDFSCTVVNEVLHCYSNWPVEKRLFLKSRKGSFQLPVLLQTLEDLLLGTTNIRAESQEEM